MRKILILPEQGGFRGSYYEHDQLIYQTPWFTTALDCSRDIEQYIKQHQVSKKNFMHSQSFFSSETSMSDVASSSRSVVRNRCCGR